MGKTAELFGVTPKTILFWESDGKIRCMKIGGGHSRFYIKEIELAIFYHAKWSGFKEIIKFNAVDNAAINIVTKASISATNLVIFNGEIVDNLDLIEICENAERERVKKLKRMVFQLGYLNNKGFRNQNIEIQLEC